MTNLYEQDSWTWFPDGDESKARSRIEVVTTHYKNFHGVKLGYLKGIVDELVDHMARTAPEVDVNDVIVYENSAFNDMVRITYDRPATPEEVAAHKVMKSEQTRERKLELLKELAELGE